ncbi:MAG: hypothetical protein U0840_04520 [Gemmataceae bacterium]
MRRALLGFSGLIGLLVYLGSATVPAAPVKPIKPFNIPVNTEADEDDPHVSDGGLTLYWTSNQTKKDDIWFTRRRTANLAWPKKGQIIEDYVTTEGDDRSVFATVGRYPHFLYFATKKDKKSKNYDLFVAVRHDDGKAWAAPTPVANVNTPEDELYPWISGDGKALYFSRKTKEGWRQFVTKRANSMGPQGWDEPEALDLPVNFHHACLTPDGKTMFLQGPLEDGRTGLFTCKREGNVWSQPEAIEALNSKEGKRGDRSPNLSRDGRLLYFASDRPDGKGGLDLWGVPVADLLKK